MFKPGDKVRYHDGSQFSNGQYVLTVLKLDASMWGEPRVWLKETNTHVSPNNITLVEKGQRDRSRGVGGFRSFVRKEA